VTRDEARKAVWKAFDLNANGAGMFQDGLNECGAALDILEGACYAAAIADVVAFGRGKIDPMLNAFVACLLDEIERGDAKGAAKGKDQR
jgi:hypothetical protein